MLENRKCYDFIESIVCVDRRGVGRPGNMSEVLAHRELLVARVGRGDRLVERGGSVLRYGREFPVVGRGELVDSSWVPDEVGP